MKCGKAGCSVYGVCIEGPSPTQWARIRITRKQAREIRPETCSKIQGPVCQVDPGEVCRLTPAR